MEEPVRMMLLDAVFTGAPISAPATPPSVLLYGLNMEGVSIAVHVNDFVPYFWFPALVCKLDGKVVPLDESSLDTIAEHLNFKVLASRKKSGVFGNRSIAAISVEYRTPLMYYRQFHIGERVPYILMANSNKLQDDMADDPIDALLGGVPVNTHVYLENKLRKPLESILEFVTDVSTLRELFTGSHTVPPPSAYVGAPNRTQGLVSNFFRPKALCLTCRKPLENRQGAFCEDCILAGHAQKAATTTFYDMAEQEVKLDGAHAECNRCHSGGHFQSVLCTNSACPVFYMRYECPQSLAVLESSLLKLDHQF